jgi:sec-independent protein translocase protein TatC
VSLSPDPLPAGGDADGPVDDEAARREARRRGEMPLAEHLREFRRRFTVALAAISVGAVIGYVLFPQFFDLLLRPYCDVIGADSCQVNAFRATDPIAVRIRASLVVGLFIGAPVLFYELWRFVAPGLTAREKRFMLPFVVMSQVMFALGLAFAVWFVPTGLSVLLTLGGTDIQPLLGANEYLSFLLTMGIGFGVVFEVPLVLVFLGAVGVLSSTALRSARRYAIVGNLVVAALVTPTDILSLFAVGVPLVVLYEVAILAVAIIERSRRRA